jgi:EAL domain-containing protein (putative c-di-GMP-specific phosphodiesterase class I)
MGKAMKKRIVAEGVESAKDIDALLKIGDMDFQGFFCGRPAPFATICAKLEEWNCGLVTREDVLMAEGVPKERSS